MRGRARGSPHPAIEDCCADPDDFAHFGQDRRKRRRPVGQRWRCPRQRDVMSLVHDPEHAASRAVRLLAHHLIDQSSKSSLAGVRLAAAKDHRPMNVPSFHVLHGSPSLVLVLNSRRLMRAGRQRGMTSTPSLDTGLLIGAEHELVRPKRLTLPAAGIQVELGAGQFRKVPIARKDPVLVAPGSERVMC